MKVITQKFMAWLMSLTVIMRYFVIALLFHVALLMIMASIKIVAIVPAIVASFTDTPLPPPSNLQDVPDDPFAAYRDFDYKGADLKGGGTGEKGPGGTPTAGNTASILTSEARGENPAVSEVIGVMSDAATAITRPTANPGGVGLESMGGMGGIGAGTAGVKGPGGPWLGVGRMGPQRSVNLAKHGGSAATEKAVIAALRWLKANQKPNGSWECYGGPVNGTPLAALAFLGHGETVDSAEFGTTVQKALEFIVASVPASGSVNGNMYSQALVVFALAEGYAMSGSPALKAPLDRGAKFIVNSQKVQKEKAMHVGGWRYTPNDVTSDMSVSGWQIMALKSAANAGVDIPHETFEKAIKYVWAMYGKPGFGYDAPATTPSMTAVGCLCAQFLGHGDDDRVTAGLKYLNIPVEWDTVGGWSMYHMYYVTQAMFQGGEQFWPKWNEQMRNMLIKNQATDGHWPCPPKSAEVQYKMNDTPVYATALGALMLETYYRFLPMYDVLKQQKKTGPALPQPPAAPAPPAAR